MMRSTYLLLPALLLLGVAPAIAQTSPVSTWTGTMSNAWNVAANWSPARVPTATDDVVIPGPSQAMNNPIVRSAVMAHTVSLSSGAVLFLDNTGQLNVYGNFINQAGTVTGAGRGTVALVGTSVQQIGGSVATSFRNLIIGAAGATTTAPVAVERGLTLKGNLAIGTNKTFTILSGPTGPGYVTNAGGVLQGTAAVQRYIDPSINPGFGYRHLSSPVTSVTFNTLQGPGYTPVFNTAYNTALYPRSTQPYPTVYGYDQSRLTSQSGAQNITEFDLGYFSPSGTDIMAPGLGYTVNLPGAANGVSGPGTVVTYNGTLTNGTVTAPVARGPQNGAGWQLLGNPYPSPLSWDAVANNPGTTGINTSLYVFKSTGQYAGTYAAYVNGIGTNGGSNVLPLGQAFFVLANTSGQVQFDNSARLTSDSTLVQRTAATVLVGARLLLSGPTGGCETAVYFQNGATGGFDAKYDAVQLPFGSLRVATTTVGTTNELAINGQAELAQQDIRVPLSFYAASAGSYQLARTDGTLPTGYRPFLLDAQLGTSLDLSVAQSTTLTLPAGSTPAGRYTLLFSKVTPLAASKSAASIETSIYPNPATGTVSVVLPLTARTGTITADIINAMGQTVVHRELAALGTAPLELPLTACAPGVYTVRLKTGSGLIAKRLIVK